jgi:hypothetical protein
MVSRKLTIDDEVVLKYDEIAIGPLDTAHELRMREDDIVEVEVRKKPVAQAQTTTTTMNSNNASEAKITLKIRSKALAKPMEFKLSKNDKLFLIFAKYREQMTQQGTIVGDNVRFTFDGLQLNEMSTPEENGMEHEDLIDASI